MPPKVKITREEIIKTALELVKIGGEESINARAVAGALNRSTQPIFSNFASMNELRDVVIAEAYNLYLTFTQSEIASGKYPEYKASGIAYIRFAMEEKELFKLCLCATEPEKIYRLHLILKNLRRSSAKQAEYLLK